MGILLPLSILPFGTQGHAPKAGSLITLSSLQSQWDHNFFKVTIFAGRAALESRFPTTERSWSSCFIFLSIPKC